MANLLLNKTLVFDEDAFTVSRGQTIDSIKAMLREQLERYHWAKKPPKDQFSKERITLTGKLGDKQDDLYVATSMCPYYGRGCTLDPERFLRIQL